jgi:hypothetical protein
MRLRPVYLPELFCHGARMLAAPTADRPVMEVTRPGQPELVQDGDHPPLGVGEAALGVAPVGQQEPGAFQRAAAQAGHPGRSARRTRRR